MAFCKYCGTKLEDGEICNCQARGIDNVTTSPSRAEVTTESKEHSDSEHHKEGESYEKVGLLEEIKAYVVSYWNNPENTVRSTMEDDSWRLTIIHVLIRAAMVSFIIYKSLVVMTEDVKDYIIRALQDTESVLSSILDLLSSGLGNLTSIVDEILMYAGEEVIRNFDITFSSEDAIVYSAVFSIVLSGIFILALFCIAKIQKSEVSLLMVAKASIANGLYITGALILIAIVSFLDVYTAMLLLVVPVLSWPICGTMTSKIVCEYNTERKKAFQLIYILSVIIVIAIVVCLVPTFVEKIYGSVTFEIFEQTVSISDLFK